MNNPNQHQAPLQLDTVRDVSAEERNKDSLQDLPPRFWSDAQEYIDVLSSRLEDATGDADSPTRPEEAVRVREELESAIELLESLADRRKAKVVKRASLAAKDIAVETDAMTGSEVELFETVRDEFTDTRLAPTVNETGSGPAATSEVDTAREAGDGEVAD